MVTNPFSSSLVASCRGPGIPSSSTQAILRSSGNGRLRPTFRTIWFVGGGVVSGECLRLGLADEVRYSILPILIGDGIPFFEKLDRDITLHLAEVKAYESGVVELRYDVRELAAA